MPERGSRGKGYWASSWLLLSILSRDRSLGFASQNMSDPQVAAVRLGEAPVERGDRLRERFPGRVRVSLTMLRHRDDEARRRSQHLGGIPLHHGDRAVQPAL